eukprot:s1003_g13.t1
MPTRCSAASSFAAILENRKVVTWGDPLEGGDSSLTCVDFCECRQCLVHVLFRQDESCLSDATLQCTPRGARLPPASTDVFVVTSTAVDEPELKTLVGEYVETGGRNHGKPVFCRRPPSEEDEEIYLYFWDSRDGPDFAGWWLGQSVGASLVWSRCEADEMLPPSSGWRIPWDGTVNEHLQVTRRAARTATKEEVKEDLSFMLQGEEELEQAPSEEQQEQLLVARDQVALVEVEATEVLETATAMLEGDVPADVAKTVVESVQAQLDSLLEVHQSLAADIVEARRHSREILPELSKLRLEYTRMQSPEEDEQAMQLRVDLSKAARALENAEEKLQSLLTAEKAGTENAPELAAEADRAMKSARSLTARQVAAARKFAPGIRTSAAAEYSKLQKKLQRLEAELKPHLAPKPPPIDPAALAELAGHLDFCRQLEQVETGIQDANSALDGGDFAPEVLKNLENDLLARLRSPNPKTFRPPQTEDALCKPGAGAPKAVAELRSRTVACKTGLDAVGTRLRDVREDLRCHKMMRTAVERVESAEDQLEVASSSRMTFEGSMFAMTAEEASEAGARCRQEADKCKTKVQQAASFLRARLGGMDQELGQSEAWILLQDTNAPVAEVELLVQKALDASAPLACRCKLQQLREECRRAEAPMRQKLRQLYTQTGRDVQELNDVFACFVRQYPELRDKLIDSISDWETAEGKTFLHNGIALGDLWQNWRLMQRSRASHGDLSIMSVLLHILAVTEEHLPSSPSGKSNDSPTPKSKTGNKQEGTTLTRASSEAAIRRSPSPKRRGVKRQKSATDLTVRLPPIRKEAALMSHGVTSTTAVLIRDELSKEFPGPNMPHTLIFDFPSVMDLTDFVLERSAR